MNAPDCRARDRKGHVCVDKFGARWDRPGVGPRPFTTCFYETLMLEEDARRTERDLVADYLRDLDELTTLEQAGVL